MLVFSHLAPESDTHTKSQHLARSRVYNLYSHVMAQHHVSVLGEAP